MRNVSMWCRRSALVLLTSLALVGTTRNVRAASAAVAYDGVVCSIACALGVAACCEFFEGTCYWCGTNYGNCVDTCSAYIPYE